MLRSNSGWTRAACQAVALLALAGVAAGISGWLRGGFPQKPQEEAPEIALEEALRENPLWIDARARADFEAEHIPDALSLSVAEWDESLPPVLEQWAAGRAAVVYCGAPAQAESREVAGRLRDFNLGPVSVLRGGWKAWKSR